MTVHPSHRSDSSLRERMIEDMTVRGFTEKTRHDYIRCVKTFAAFIGRSPDAATPEDLQRFQLHQTQAGVQPPASKARSRPCASSSPSSTCFITIHMSGEQGEAQRNCGPADLRLCFRSTVIRNRPPSTLVEGNRIAGVNTIALAIAAIDGSIGTPEPGAASH